MALFERRHYDWLADWAGENIGPKAAARLAIALSADNPRFSRELFGEAYLARRAYIRANFPNTLIKD